VKTTILGFIVCLIAGMIALPASAQWTWKGQLYFNTNQNLYLPVNFADSVDISVGQGFTVKAPAAVRSNGYTMCKRGGGRFWFMADNPLFDGNIVYRGKSDTVRLDGVFGPFVNSAVGYMYAGSIVSSPDSLSFFHLHQNDTTVQTFKASGYNRTNKNLYIYSDTRSKLRITHSSDSLAGTVRLSAGGRLYIDGSYDAKIWVSDSSRLITGENSVAGHSDYANFANSGVNDTAIVVSRGSVLQIGERHSPSLAHVEGGHLVQRDGSTLEIDVYDPRASWNLTDGIHTNWKSSVDSSFSDRIYLGHGDYFFGADSKIRLNCAPAYIDSIASDSVFYLPVIMLNTYHQINGAGNVSVHQNLGGWHLEFILGDGNNNTVNGWGYVRGRRTLPDNVSDADCYGTPPAFAWGIAEKFGHNAVTVSTFSTVCVGDLNGDGYPELVALAGQVHAGMYAARLIVYLGPNHTQINTINAKGNSIAVFDGGGVALLKAKIAGKDSAFIVVQDYDGFLYAFNYTGAHIWKSSAITGITATKHYDIGIADFNNDGQPEIYCGPDIFNASTGVKICSSPGNYGLSPSWTSQSQIPQQYKATPFAADVTGDGKLEYIAGNQVYSVDIAGGSMTLLYTVPPPTDQYGTTMISDGKTQVADFDNDGYLDVVVSGVNISALRSNVWIWSPTKQTVLARISNNDVRNQSYPFIGDIDGCGQPEILFIASYQQTGNISHSQDSIRAYKYDNSMLLKQFWRLSHSDRSGSTGITLFDFNQDGTAEIVFRDESHLRIINGSLKSHKTGADTIAYNLYSTLCYSATGYEYPVIADIDGDGSAEIVIGGHPTDNSFPTIESPIRIFKSGTSNPWAPARKVWNQYAYNAVNINEDLTIPKYQLNPATVFPNGKRPYNNFLQQQTILNIDGDPLWLLPDFALVGSMNTHYHTAGDSLVISNLCIKNEGDARGGDSIQIAVYRNSRAPSNLINVYKRPAAIDLNDTRCYSIKINGVSSIGAANLYIEINDNGLRHPQTECDSTTNNGGSISLASIPIARNDRIVVFTCSNKIVNVLANDANTGGNSPNIIQDGKLGTASPSGTNIAYANDKSIDGGCTKHGGRRDTVVYRVCSGSNCSDAMLIVNILRTPAIKLADSCSRHPYLTVNYQYPAASYQWHKSSDGVVWTLISGSPHLKLYVTEDAWYKATVTYNGDTIETSPVHFVIHRKAQLPGNLWWYESFLSND
jgi:hypothetical protein